MTVLSAKLIAHGVGRAGMNLTAADDSQLQGTAFLTAPVDDAGKPTTGGFEEGVAYDVTFTKSAVQPAPPASE